MTQDRYQAVAKQFNEYLKDFFAPPDNHTTYHFGYKPVIDNIRETKNFPDISLFDYGSGAGQFCAYLNELGVDVTGYEISNAMLQTARQNFPDLADRFLNKIPGDLKNTFDICTMNFVTCEIQGEKELDKIISNAFDLLKPQGKLIILTNNPEANPKGVRYNIWSIASVDIKTEGADVKTTIHTDDTNFELNDYFWSEKFVQNKLQTVGLDQIVSFNPKLENITDDIWEDELKYPPTLIYSAIKP